MTRTYSSSVNTRRGSDQHQEKARVRFVWDLGNASAWTGRSKHPGVDSWNASKGRGTPMRRALMGLVAALALAAPASAETRYSVTDKGGFGSTGRFVEFATRYGWDTYELDFDFGVDEEAQRLTKGSRLRLTINRRDGSSWDYTCKASRSEEMQANVNRMLGKGTSVLTECRIDARKFAKSLEIDEDLVGEPVLVFHVMIDGGRAVAGLQKGLYFAESNDISVGEMAGYASAGRDPSDLGVLFASAELPYALNPEYSRSSRYLP